jgi:aminoacyl tRNA synthase complex-interacting multifunctional protein 1
LLLGGSANGAELSQWLSFSRQISLSASSKNDMNRLMSTLNSVLACRSYLVGSFFTLADASVAESVIGLKLAKYPEVLRWMLHVLAFCPGATLPASALPQSPPPLVFPILKRGEASIAANKEVKLSGGSEESKGGEGGGKKEKEKEGKKDKKEGKDKTAKPADDKETAAAAPTAAADDLDPSKLDFRVGYVVKCWDHPEAEKLLCEEIDCGEPSGPRQIASGLKAFYRAEEVQGRKVIVLANLKDRNLVGFKSQVSVALQADVIRQYFLERAHVLEQGMVICASNADHSIVKLLEPPANANVGDRVTFDGFSGEPASSAQVAKKKILERLAPDVRLTI